MPINVVAVLIAALAAFLFGWLYYSPAVVGKQWMKLSGMTEADMKKAKEKGMGKTMLAGFLNQLVTAYVLAMVLMMVGATGADALGVAAWLWLGFVATTQFGGVLWGKVPPKLFFLNTVHAVLGLLIMAAVIVNWPM